jgi:hypothetical protein
MTLTPARASALAKAHEGTRARTQAQRDAGRKRCPRCCGPDETLPLAQFQPMKPQRKNSTGLRPYCQKCTAAYQQAWREAKREREYKRAQRAAWLAAQHEARAAWEASMTPADLKAWQAAEQAKVRRWLRSRPQSPDECWACGGQGGHDGSCPVRTPAPERRNGNPAVRGGL